VYFKHCFLGQTIIFLPCDFYLSSFFFPRLISAALDWMSAILPHMVPPYALQDFKALYKSQIGCLPYFHTWCGLSVNLRCRSETCCTRLTGNTGRKKVAKNLHLGTVAQLCWAISSQLRHVLTVRKKTC